MAEADLNTRLEDLGRRIEKVQARLKLKGLLSADHQIKASELLERYKALSEKMNVEVAEKEAQGHHVSNLERSVRQWLDSLEIEMD